MQHRRPELTIVSRRSQLGENKTHLIERPGEASSHPGLLRKVCLISKGPCVVV